MWNFDADEFGFLIVAGVLVVVALLRYYVPLFSIRLLGKPCSTREALAVLPPAVLLPTLLVLVKWTDPQVRGHLDYITLFVVGGMLWIMAALYIMPLLGISVRRDVLEGCNSAALLAVCGITGGVGIIYALANVGAGPTIWTTLLPALGASLMLALAWLLMLLVGGDVVDAITIDRDMATGLRAAGAMLACAVIVGRAGAGNWTSWQQTWHEMGAGSCPALVLAGVAGLLHRFCRPSPALPRPLVFTHGWIPAVVFVLSGVWFVVAFRQGLHPYQW